MRRRWENRSPEESAHVPPPEVFERKEWKDRLHTLGKTCDLHTVPLWCRKSHADPGPELQGSGLLLQIAGMHFLITALHVMKLNPSLRIRRDKMEFRPLPSGVRYSFLDYPIDIAALPLSDDYVKEMDPTHSFATLAVLDPSDRLAPRPAPYMTFGYLSALTGPGAVNYQTTSAYYFSSKHQGADSGIPGFSSTSQLAVELQADDRTTDLDGFRKELPELGGMSGSGIWRTGQAPEMSIHLVGISTRWNKKPALVIGTQIEVVLALIASAHPELRASIDLHVGTTWMRHGWTPRFRLPS